MVQFIAVETAVRMMGRIYGFEVVIRAFVD